MNEIDVATSAAVMAREKLFVENEYQRIKNGATSVAGKMGGLGLP